MRAGVLAHYRNEASYSPTGVALRGVERFVVRTTGSPRSQPQPVSGRWPAAPTPRDKIVFGDPGALSDHELLGVLLGSTGRGSSTGDVAHTLLQRFGSLRGVVNAELFDWQSISGVGFARYAELRAAAELGRRCLAEYIVRDGPLESPVAAGEYLRALLRDRQREVFGCLLLDTRHRVMRFEELFAGTLDGAVVHPREVVRIALLRNAAAVIAVHNHPSGNPEPSQADIALTHRLRDALDVVDVRLLDHLVVGDNKTVSLSRRGHL